MPIIKEDKRHDNRFFAFVSVKLFTVLGAVVGRKLPPLKRAAAIPVHFWKWQLLIR
jgi:hypothetical protein